MVFVQCSENRELLEKVSELERQLASACSDKTAAPCEHNILGDYVKELDEKIKIQVVEVFFFFFDNCLLSA